MKSDKTIIYMIYILFLLEDNYSHNKAKKYGVCLDISFLYRKKRTNYLLLQVI